MSIRGLVDAARRLADDRGTIIPAIAEATGLSPEGVDLALSKHLETNATDEDIAKLEASTPKTSKVSVVLAANVFVGALRAIAVARAAAPVVVVRPSRRDPTFARLLVEAAADPAIAIVDKLDVASIDEGEIHVYGRDDTIADVRARARPGVVVRGHGSGMGVAYVTDVAQAKALAEDVVVFDQRGCLSPRFALVEGDEARALAFAEALHDELEAFDASIPRGDVPGDERAAIGTYIATMTYASKVLVGTSHAVGVAPHAAPLILPPSYRHVHVAPVKDVAEAAKLLEPLAKGIAIVGAENDSLTKALGIRVRTAPIGRMQRPPLDGPVDLRG